MRTKTLDADLRGSARITAIVEVGGRSRLEAQQANRFVAVTVPAVGDRSRAQRWLGTVRRVERVSVHIEGEAVRCRVTGVRSRLPFTTDVPLELALGLARLGLPTHLEGIH